MAGWIVPVIQGILGLAGNQQKSPTYETPSLGTGLQRESFSPQQDNSASRVSGFVSALGGKGSTSSSIIDDITKAEKKKKILDDSSTSA